MEKKVLLIADDDEMNRMIIKKFLSDEFKIFEAADGETTLEILNSEPVDAVLLDIIMPKGDGFYVLDKIKPHEKFDYLGILVATSTKEKTERQALSLGADDVVSKPYDPVVIKKRLTNILKMKTFEKERDMLVEGNVEDVISEDLKSCSNEVVELTDKLKMLADIIRGNTTNEKLILETANSVEKEANKIEKIMK